ncbi:MAG TPA: hypothetical protein V6D06_20250 [Trichocoleus sp.]
METLPDQFRLFRSSINLKNPIAQRLSLLRYQKLLGEVFCEQVETSSFPTRFVVFRFPAADDGYACTLLNQHPEILCHGNVFDPTRIHYSEDFQKLLGDGMPLSRYALIRGKVGPMALFERDRTPERFCIKLWQNSYSAKAVGFSLLPSHVPNTTFSLLRDKGVKKILLVRKNKLEAYLHWQVTRKIPLWQAVKTRSAELPKIAVNLQALLRWSQQHDRYFNQLREELDKTGQSYVEVAHEDLQEGSNDLLKARLLKFLGVSMELKHLACPVEKPSYSHLPVLVKNFDEIREQLRASSLESLVLERA